MRTSVLLLLSLCCAVFGAPATRLSKYTQEEVQELLEQWRLEKAFAKDFKRHGFDGSVLDVLDEDEAFDSNLFPDTSPIFWKVLLRKVSELKTTMPHAKKRRSLAAKLDTSKFKGIRVRTDNAIVALGKKQDVQLVRTGNKKLTIFGDVEIKGNMKYAGGGGTGDVRVGNSNTACTNANTGAIRYLGPKKGLFFCDGKKFHALLTLGAEWISVSGRIFSQFKIGKGEGFARDDLTYCINCPDPGVLHISTDFRIGGGDSPFNYYGSCNGKCEIGGDKKGNVHLSGSNGNDAVRMKKALLKGDFEYGCTVTSGTSGHNRFGMGLWGGNAVSQFKSGNSAGYCAQASSGNCYFCRFEGAMCAFRGSYNKVVSLPNIHDANVEFKFVRKSGQICVFTKGAKRGCYSQKYTGDMYGAIQNDGGSSRNLHKCYYKPLGKVGPKANFPFATIKARNSDKSAITSYSLVNGKLPPGMKLDSKSGMIYGKPATVSKATKYDFDLQAKGEGGTIKRAFTIEVRHRTTVDVRSTDFSQGSGKVFKYVGSCNGKCEIASDSNGNIKLDGTNGNDAIIMQKPLLKGDFEYGCTVTLGNSKDHTHNRFGMGLWDQASYSQFKSANSAGYCAQANKGNCYFCRFEGSSCAFRGSYTAVFGLKNIHTQNARFMFKRTGKKICAYMNDKQSGCYPQQTDEPLYGAIQNDGGPSRNLHKCYYKTSSGKIVYK